MDPVLTLSTIEPVRPRIAIEAMVDGEKKVTFYDLALPEDFGLRELAALRRSMISVSKVAGDIAAATDEEIEMAEKSIDTVMKKIVPTIEDGILSKLNFEKKTAIVRAFRSAAPATAPAAATEEKPKNTTGEQPAPASSASTEETPDAGSTSPSDSSTPTP